MQIRTAALVAISVVAIMATVSAAVGANLGILRSSDDGPIGHLTIADLSSAATTVTTTATPATSPTPTSVIVSPDSTRPVSVPAATTARTEPVVTSGPETTIGARSSADDAHDESDDDESDHDESDDDESDHDESDHDESDDSDDDESDDDD